MATTKRTKATPKPTTAAAKAATSASAGASAVSLDSVAARAYQLWLESGCVAGNDDANWFRAEQELRAQAAR
jgi:hypothetical protein